jgi:hypothetical protein
MFGFFQLKKFKNENWKKNFDKENENYINFF